MQASRAGVLTGLANAVLRTAFASVRLPASQAFSDGKRVEGQRQGAAVIYLALRRGKRLLAMLKAAIPYDPARQPAASDRNVRFRRLTRTWASPAAPNPPSLRVGRQRPPTATLPRHRLAGPPGIAADRPVPYRAFAPTSAETA